MPQLQALSPRQPVSHFSSPTVLSSPSAPRAVDAFETPASQTHTRLVNGLKGAALGGLVFPATGAAAMGIGTLVAVATLPIVAVGAVAAAAVAYPFILGGAFLMASPLVVVPAAMAGAFVGLTADPAQERP